MLPANIIWGGAIENSPESLLPLEMVSLIVTLPLALMVATKTGYIEATKFKKAINIGI